MTHNTENDAPTPVPPGPCWADSGHTWPGVAEGTTVRCDLLAGHAGAHQADRGSMGGTAVWPNDSEAHDVKFHVGTGTVVCTCGAYFESERFGVTMPRSAVSLWAEHVRLTRPIPPAKAEGDQ